MLSERIAKMAKEQQRKQDMERIEQLFREAEQRSNDNADSAGKALKQCHVLSEALKTRVLQQDFDQLFDQTMQLPTHETISRLNQ